MKRLLALMMVLLLGACTLPPSDLQKPRVAIAGASVKSVGLLEQRVTLTLRVENPNRVALPLEGLDTRLTVNGETLATGVSNTRSTIPALGEGMVKVDVTSDLVRLMRQFKKLGDGVRYKVDGRVFVQGWALSVPFSSEGSLDELLGGHIERY
ncbi:LEA type 2 family protein [Chitinibacteraceae bacterium HSL-7]